MLNSKKMLKYMVYFCDGVKILAKIYKIFQKF